MKLRHISLKANQSKDIKGLRIEATEMVEGKWHILVTDANREDEKTAAIGFNVTTEDEG